MEEKDYKAFCKMVENTLKLKRDVDLFVNPSLFIVRIDSIRLALCAEFINKNDVLIRYIVRIKNGKAIIYNNLFSGSNPFKPTVVDIYEKTTSPSNVANFFKKELKDFKEKINKTNKIDTVQ